MPAFLVNDKGRTQPLPARQISKQMTREFGYGETDAVMACVSGG